MLHDAGVNDADKMKYITTILSNAIKEAWIKVNEQYKRKCFIDIKNIKKENLQTSDNNFIIVNKKTRTSYPLENPIIGFTDYEHLYVLQVNKNKDASIAYCIKAATKKMPSQVINDLLTLDNIVMVVDEGLLSNLMHYYALLTLLQVFWKEDGITIFDQLFKYVSPLMLAKTSIHTTQDVLSQITWTQNTVYPSVINNENWSRLLQPGYAYEVWEGYLISPLACLMVEEQVKKSDGTFKCLFDVNKLGELFSHAALLDEMFLAIQANYLAKKYLRLTDEKLSEFVKTLCLPASDTKVQPQDSSPMAKQYLTIIATCLLYWLNYETDKKHLILIELSLYAIDLIKMLLKIEEIEENNYELLLSLLDFFEEKESCIYEHMNEVLDTRLKNNYNMEQLTIGSQFYKAAEISFKLEEKDRADALLKSAYHYTEKRLHHVEAMPVNEETKEMMRGKIKNEMKIIQDKQITWDELIAASVRQEDEDEKTVADNDGSTSQNESLPFKIDPFHLDLMATDFNISDETLKNYMWRFAKKALALINAQRNDGVFLDMKYPWSTTSPFLMSIYLNPKGDFLAEPAYVLKPSKSATAMIEAVLTNKAFIFYVNDAICLKLIQYYIVKSLFFQFYGVNGTDCFDKIFSKSPLVLGGEGKVNHACLVTFDNNQLKTVNKSNYNAVNVLVYSNNKNLILNPLAYFLVSDIACLNAEAIVNCFNVNKIRFGLKHLAIIDSLIFSCYTLRTLIAKLSDQSSSQRPKDSLVDRERLTKNAGIEAEKKQFYLEATVFYRSAFSTACLLHHVYEMEPDTSEQKIKNGIRALKKIALLQLRMANLIFIELMNSPICFQMKDKLTHAFACMQSYVLLQADISKMLATIKQTSDDTDEVDDADALFKVRTSDVFEYAYYWLSRMHNEQSLALTKVKVLYLAQLCSYLHLAKNYYASLSDTANVTATHTYNKHENYEKLLQSLVIYIRSMWPALYASIFDSIVAAETTSGMLKLMLGVEQINPGDYADHLHIVKLVHTHLHENPRSTYGTTMNPHESFQAVNAYPVREEGSTLIAGLDLNWAPRFFQPEQRRARKQEIQELQAWHQQFQARK